MTPQKTAVVLFAGAGGWERALSGYKTLSVELDHAKVAWLGKTLHQRVVQADVRFWAPPQKFHHGKLRLLCASPVCKHYSRNSVSAEDAWDIECAEAVVRILRLCRPSHFCLENVMEYARGAAYGTITKGLDDLGYMWLADEVYAADYGVPQSRRRLILRARHGTDVRWFAREIKATHGPDGARDYVSWYSALRRLEPKFLADTLAPWQAVARSYAGRPLLLSGGNSNGGKPQAKAAGDFAPCLTVKILGHGDRVCRVSSAGLGVLQGFPADTPWPKGERLAQSLIGNAIPPPLATAVFKSLGVLAHP